MARRSPDQPSGLSRERILAAARSLADREGIDALSMRRLAQDLDVWPMSVYRYFADKDALLDALAADAVAGVDVSAAGGSWRERLPALLDAARAAIAAAPGTAERVPRALLTDAGLALPGAGVELLCEAGLAPREAAAAWAALWSYTVGFVATRSDPRAVRAAIAALPEGEHPALAAVGPELARELSEDEAFAAGLKLLLDGVEARAAWVSA